MSDLTGIPKELCGVDKSQWCEYAAKRGNLGTLQWARSHDAPWNITCARAAFNDHLEILQWARSHGAPWDKLVCALAAANGHLEILQWARSHGAPWDEMTCSYAASNGHLEILQWARSHGAPWSRWICDCALENEHFGVLQWAISNGAPWDHKSIMDSEQLILHHYRGVAVCLMKHKRGTPKIDLMSKRFICKLYMSLPLISPLCDLIINYG